MKTTLKEKIKKIIQFIMNPRLLLCLGIAWIITNGWSYVMFALGTYFGINWMIAVSGGYLAFLWIPVSPEKLATVAIAILLLKLLFPDDKKTLGILIDMKNKVKSKVKEKVANHKERKKSEKSEENEVRDQKGSNEEADTEKASKEQEDSHRR